jgi:hypothetical protein
MSPPLDLSDRLRRDHGMHRAAQVLADASRIRQGLRPLPLKAIDPEDRAWFKQAARQAIEVFELVTQPDREPDAVVEQRETAAAQASTKLALALESRLAIERSKASVQAAERGHELSTWQPTHPVDGEEMARCQRCGRHVRISLGAEPVLTGLALTEGCLVAAGTEQE